MEAVEERHKEEIQTAKEEMKILLQQRDALQNQVTATAIATPVIKQAVSPLCAFPWQSSRLMG